MRSWRLVPAALCALALIPASAQADAFKPSKADQVTLGARVRDDIRKKERVVPDSDERVQLVRRIGGRLLDELDLSKEPWKFSFDVISNSQINAFALPGGPIFLFSGLIDNMKTEDELAAVMAHEIAHVTREHWAYAYAEQQKRDLLLVGLALIFRTNSTVNNLLSITGDMVVGLPYSRKHESESDTIGLRTLGSARFNPNGMVDVFEMMAKKAGGGSTPEFLRTHPTESTRIKKVRDQIQAMGGDYPPQTPLPWVERARRIWR